jgi:hypothetical protein
MQARRVTRLSHRPVAVATMALLGGLIASIGAPGLSAQAADGEVTFAKDIAIILQENCQVCHQPGSIAPMSLMTYEEAAPWAPLIANRVSEGVMPPFPIDGSIGIQEFKNDVRLSADEIRKVEQWAASGAPLGDVADMPPPKEWPDFTEHWNYAEVFDRAPDFVIASPPYVVTANGMDHWPNLYADVEGLAGERYIRAIEIKPANPAARYVFHHGNPSLIQDGQRSGLIASAVGSEGQIFPADAGKLIKPGAVVDFGMHYYPIDEDVEAIMELGLWFYEEGNEPAFETPGQVQHRTEMSTGAGGYPGHSRQISRRADLLIPPHSKAMYRGVYVLDKPARIHDLRGHMHVRGEYQVLEAVYPDGRWEVINKLDWDHGWHTTFIYEDHVAPLLPKGTVLILTSTFDNTEGSYGGYNPDPDQWVVAGSRTVDEMAHMWIGITYFEDEEDFERLVAERERLLAELESERDVLSTASADGDDR